MNGMFTGAILFVLGLITACTVQHSSTQMPTTTPTIGANQAIETAISVCKTPHLVLVGEPHNIRSKLTTLEEADQYVTSNGGTTSNYGIPLDSQVWIIQMDGQLQLIGGPPPAAANDNRLSSPTSSLPTWGTCTAVIDARSGKPIFEHN